MISTSPPASELLPDRAIPHAACPSSSSCITTTLSYFSLNKRESQRECLWKPTPSCSESWLSIDSATVSQEREPTISQFLQNVAVRPKLWHTTVPPHLDWVRFRPSETSFNMAAAAETKWRWDLHMVNWGGMPITSQDDLPLLTMCWGCFFMNWRVLSCLVLGTWNDMERSLRLSNRYGSPPRKRTTKCSILTITGIYFSAVFCAVFCAVFSAVFVQSFAQFSLQFFVQFFVQPRTPHWQSCHSKLKVYF